MIRRNRTAANGFTLVEMLTVIAIITLLIGILVPALSSARNSATKAAVRAQIQSIATGCVMFKNDDGEFPRSNPYTYGPLGDSAGQTTAMTNWEVTNLNGAHLIVDAMIGRDSLGYDPKIGTGAGASIASRWYGGQDGSGNTRLRRDPYVKPEGISLASVEKPPEDAFGPVPGGTDVVLPRPDNSDARTTVFIDKFGFALLYYRANPRATQSMPLMQTSTAADANVSNGVYDGRDNEMFTSQGSAPNIHRIKDANDAGIAWAFPGTPSDPPLANQFGEYIRSIRATTYDDTGKMVFPRPVFADSYIILSAGKDGIYGTLDDVANFEVLSENR